MRRRATRPRRHGLVVSCLWALGLALSSSARATDASWTIAWRAPASCPTEQDVRQTVRDWLAQSVEPRAALGIAIDAEVAQSEHGYALELTLKTPSGESTEQLTAERCETLAGVVALKVALAADPGAAFAAAGAGDDDETQPWGVRLAIGLSEGILPGAGPNISATGSWQLTPAAFELGVGYALPNEANYAAHPEVGAELDALYGSARVCVLPNVGDVAFPICGGAEAGVMRGQGFGVAETSTSTQSFAVLVLGPALRVPLTELVHAWLGFDALVPVVRPEYHVRNLDPLHRPQRVGARVQLGTELRF